MAAGLSRELAYHSELAEKLYTSAIRYARRDRDGKAAECLERAVEHEARAAEIAALMTRRSTAKLVNLRDGKTWGKDSDAVETLHITMTPGGDAVIHRPALRDYRPKPPADDSASAAPLGLSPLTNCTATQQPRKNLSYERARRGSKGISSKNRKDIRSAAVLMESKYGRNRLAFATMTIPCHSLRQAALIAANADVILDVFEKRLRRRLQSVNLPLEYLFVWELQKRGMLHAHGLFCGRHGWSGWAISPEEFTEMWRAAVAAVLGEAVKTFNFGPSCRIERPRNSVARELSKYLSKGCKSQITELQGLLKSQCENAGIEPVDLLPRSWVSISKPLKSLIIQHTRHATVEKEKASWNWYDLDNMIRQSRKCVSKPRAAGGGPLTRVIKTEWGYPVAFIARLKEPDFDFLVDCVERVGESQGSSVSKIA